MAIADLKKIYENDPSKKANLLLVKALVDNQDYLAAKEYMLEKINDYQDSEANFKLMVKIFGLNHNFIQAQIMIRSVKNGVFQSELQNDFNRLQREFINSHPDEINKMEMNLYHIGGAQLPIQQQIITESMNLPVPNYVDGAKGALSDPFLYPAIRFSLLDVLRELQFTQFIDINWLDKKVHRVNLFKLVPLSETMSAVGIFNVLERRFGQTSPTIFQNMVKTFNLFLAYLYPFGDEIVTDYSLWVSVAYQMQKGNHLDLNQLDDDAKAVYDWQFRLLKIIESIK
ncbi:hypothetical protein [Lactobacillus sp. Sy-1]|uniref:hypothetical protein n=1 Tax=Lactobacillus sp. Sy-1 TaxID=2109645 RepID=UPI001C578680|nr:hypothetical protein [Lactobacillus sp. Sy-1]MBW1605455.1 hypothetical protein [Lactobacillus sp. Sy-1]